MTGSDYNLSMDVATEALHAVNPQEFYSKALLESRSTSHFRQVLNHKEKAKIGEVGFQDPVQPFGCTWNGKDSNLGAKEMECDKLMIQTEICLSEIESSFLQQWLQPGTTGVDLPGEFRQHFYNELAKAVNNSLEYMTWRGDKSLDYNVVGSIACTDGLEKKLAAAAIPVGQRIPLVVGGVDKTNIIAELGKMYDVIPPEFDDKPEEINWFIPSAWAKYYRQALADASSEAYYAGNKPLDFLGIELKVGKGMSADVSTLSRAVNYIMLADLLSDQENIKVVDQSNTTAIYTMRITSVFKFGVDYLNDSEWVVYNIAEA